MAIDEQSRHRMYLKLEEALGPEAAATMMEHLPPVGWADVTTKRDLEHLELRIENKLAAMEARFERALRSQLITMLTVMSGLFVALVTLAFAAARLS